MRFRLAIIVLAAGGSKRLGTPKQIVPFKESTILQHAINQAVKAHVGDVFVVLGANAEIITDKHLLSDVRVLINDEWESGIAGSIVMGLQHIIAEKRYERVIIMLADQPFLKATHLQQLVKLYKKSFASIIVSRYREGYGPPSLFTDQHFDALLNLKGDVGGKSIIDQHFDAVEFIDFPKGNIDIDTNKDLGFLL